MVEAGETLTDAVIREVREETAVAIEPVTLAGYREMIVRDGDTRVARAFRDPVLCRALDIRVSRHPTFRKFRKPPGGIRMSSNR